MAITVWTLVWLFSGMEAHMRLEMMISGETFMTFWTLKRFFTSVCPLMILEHVLIAETTVTDAASEALARCPILGGSCPVLGRRSSGRQGVDVEAVTSGPLLVQGSHSVALVAVGGAACRSYSFRYLQPVLHSRRPRLTYGQTARKKTVSNEGISLDALFTRSLSFSPLRIKLC